MTAFDRDDLIRMALTPEVSVHAPVDLGDDILRTVSATPQRRSIIPSLPAFRWLPTMSPAMALAALVALLLLLGAVLTIANRPPPAPPGLTVYHGGAARTGVLPGPGPRGDPMVLWSNDLEGHVQVTTMPVVIDGTVYVVDGAGSVWAFDAATGAQRGERLTLGSAVVSAPTVAFGALLVGADDGSVSAIDLATFHMRWRTPVSPGQPIRASLLAVGHIVYVASLDGTLYRLDATGAVVGRTSIGAPISRGPALADGVVYVGTDGGTIAAVSQWSGTVSWTLDDGPGDIGTPTVVGSTLYVARGLHVATAPHEIVAIDVADHAERWRFGSPRGAEILAGAATDEQVFAVAKDGYVYELDATDGGSRWNTDTGSPIGAVAGLVGGVLYVTNDGREVIAIDAATGAIRWRVPVEGTPSMAAVIDGRVFVATSVGKMVALGDPPAASPSGP